MIERAKKELKRIGYIPLDQDQEDGPDKWIQENLLELLEVFSKQDHSGFSALHCIESFSRLAQGKLLAPVKSLEEFDFMDISYEGQMQSTLISSVFSNKDSDRAYYLNAIVFRDYGYDENNEKFHLTFTGSVDAYEPKRKEFLRLSSRQTILLPWTPVEYIVNLEKNYEKEAISHAEKVGASLCEDENSNKYVYELVDLEEISKAKETYDVDVKVIIKGERAV